MPRRKKSGSGGGYALLFVLFLGLLAAVPREAWIGAACLFVVGFAIYALKKPSKAEPETPTPSQRDAEPPFNRSSRAAEVPVSSPRAAPAEASTYSTPPAPQSYGPGKWIPAGQTVEVAGTSIQGGLIYVGSHLPTPNGANDPCLIDPSKTVSLSGDYAQRDMGYWPSYSQISSMARRAYLNWLAGGRSDPAADVGYVFIFFYGLERRAIVDAAKDQAARADWPVIAAELRRLLRIYGPKSGSFQGYAGALLDWVELAEHPARLYERPIPVFPRSFELPLYLRLALGQTAMDGVPVPAHLALAWARLDPNISLRTPATRCSEQFERLFFQKYAELKGGGITLPKNRTKLKFFYRPASAGFRGHDDIKLNFGDTPDVTALTAPANKLKEVVEAATTPLESFSRLVGKDPAAKDSLEALLQLPAPLWPERSREALQALKGRMTGGTLQLRFDELLQGLGATSVFTRERCVSLARALETAGLGFEPDVLAGARMPKPEERVVVFATPTSETQSRTDGAYLVATLTLQLASAVAAADGEFSDTEVEHLRQSIGSWNHLTPSQSTRLNAHLQLLQQAPASLTGLKKRLEPLTVPVRETLAGFMATLVQSDGSVSPAEVKMLEKVYKALGLDAGKVFSDVHAVAAGAASLPCAVKKVETSGFKLDVARIAALQADTDKVSAMLAGIFADAEAATPAPAEAVETTEPEPEVVAPVASVLDLDEAHTALARMMLSRPEWSRAELLDLAADLELMLDGALEHINDAAFDQHDMPFFEGEDPVTVNTEILEKVAA